MRLLASRVAVAALLSIAMTGLSGLTPAGAAAAEPCPPAEAALPLLTPQPPPEQDDPECVEDGTGDADGAPEGEASDNAGDDDAADQAEPVVARPAAPKPGAGKPVLRKGDTGRLVNVLQVRLQRVRTYDAPVTGRYAKATVAAVKDFQRKKGFVRSGAVDAATRKALVNRAGKVTKRDIAAGRNSPYGSRPAASCMTGRVVCVDKTARTVRWMVGGKVRMKLDARFGGPATQTREGVFQIFFKSRDHVSSLYDASMPFALFFSGGQAVHYSPDFASTGYNGASHGCVNTREYGKMRALFDKASVGDRVVVYRSKTVRG